MTQFSFQDAKAIVTSICKSAEDNEFLNRKSFIDMIDANPNLAVQGYNAYGKIFYWNPASTDVYGYRENEAVNQDLTELVIPPEMRTFALDMIRNGARTGKMPEPSACDLIRSNGEYITVYSGHLVFQWDDSSSPEFYCLDLPVQSVELD